MPSSIVAGRNFPVPARSSASSVSEFRGLRDRGEGSLEERIQNLEELVEDLAQSQKGPAAAHRRRIAESVNQVGQAAFSPRSYGTYPSASATVTSTSWTTFMEFEEITVPIPCRFFGLAVVEYFCTNNVDPLELAMTVQPSGGAESTLAATIVKPPTGARLSDTVMSPSIDRDLEKLRPGFSYHVRLKARLTAATAGSYTLEAGVTARRRSALHVRVEPRLLPEEAR